MRDRLVDDYRMAVEDGSPERVPQRIIQVVFDGRDDLIEYHFFNELDNIAKYEDIEDYPEAMDFMNLYPNTFIEAKVNACFDPELYHAAELVFHGFLCSYSTDDMRTIRRRALYDMHCFLLERDYGQSSFSIISDNPGVIREAADLIDFDT